MRTLIYDLEISPMLGWAYEMWDARILHVEREPHIMAVGYKWLGEDGSAHCLTQPDFEDAYKRDPYSDARLVMHLWDLMDQADIVVAHNARKFDNRVAQARFLLNDMVPPSPFKTVDTLQAARRFFRFGSNSLNDLCKKLEIGQKPETTHAKLWHKCLGGDMEAWEKMRDYCKNDVELLEDLYLRLQPYITNHPNVTMFDSLTGCPTCGSTKLQYRGIQHTNTLSYRRVHCQNCGAWSRERLSLKDDEGKTLRPEFVGVTG